MKTNTIRDKGHRSYLSSPGPLNGLALDSFFIQVILTNEPNYILAAPRYVSFPKRNGAVSVLQSLILLVSDFVLSLGHVKNKLL